MTYKYFGAPDGATAARVPISMRPEELGGDELGMGGMFTKIKPETMAAMVLTGIEGVPLHKVPPAGTRRPAPRLRGGEAPHDRRRPPAGHRRGSGRRGGLHLVDGPGPRRPPRDAFDVYQLLHEWQDFSKRLHEAGHQPYCLVWP
ncbi:hypothetical protein GCM10020256_31830 [Streptomyces thermocoprophilus]